VTIDTHRGGKGGGRYETAPPRQIFEKLVNKNAIKRKIGGPPLAIFPETLDPLLGILAKTSSTPSPPLDFQPVCIYDCQSTVWDKKSFK
jgi:hypothetical protein